MKAKNLINRCFNVGRFIATIREANANPGIPQCENCWRWGHLTFSCRIQGSKCVKCNGPHKLEITVNLAGVAKPIWRPIPLILKLKRVSHILTHSNVLTAVVNIKQTQLLVHSGKIGSIGTGIKGSILRSVKTESSQFIQSWMRTLKHDFWQLKNLFPECSQKHFYRQHHSRDLLPLWYHSLTRTSMVHHSYYSQLYLL